LPAAVLLVQGVVGMSGMLACMRTASTQRHAMGALAAALQIAFACAILLTRSERREAVRTFAIRYVMVVAAASLFSSLAFGSSEVTGLFVVWSFALLGVLLGEATVPRLFVCVASLLLFDGMFFVGIAKNAFQR